jgi:hypothetical protein
MQPQTDQRSDDKQRIIAERAHQIFEARGSIEGTDMDDWYEAERQLAADGAIMPAMTGAQAEEEGKVPFA